MQRQRITCGEGSIHLGNLCRLATRRIMAASVPLINHVTFKPQYLKLVDAKARFIVFADKIFGGSHGKIFW